ncbi:MAG: hypothetical protein IT562_10790 [Alphaproteobacteria bacterium]|nr:hypothetical protein [Alphaproteobacteria bacterium]
MYSLKIWTKPGSDEIRLYINGTTRQSVYFALARDGQHVVWSSKANDTPHKFQTGDHYGKVRKDGAAAEEVAEAFDLKLGAESTRDDWDRIVQIARDGIQVEPQ